MEYIHVKNLEKYHPGYKDRNLIWAKIDFGMVQGDPDFELIASEVDKWRFVAMICLELEAQSPLPNIGSYWRKKGFNLRHRPMSSTLKVLQNFLQVVTETAGFVTEDQKLCSLEKRREDKIREEIVTDPLLENQSVKEAWERFRVFRNTELHKKLTPMAERGALKRLARFSGGQPEIAIEIIEQSIDNSWQGVWPLKRGGIPLVRIKPKKMRKCEHCGQEVPENDYYTKHWIEGGCPKFKLASIEVVHETVEQMNKLMDEMHIQPQKGEQQR